MPNVKFDRKSLTTGEWLRYWTEEGTTFCSLSSQRWARIKARCDAPSVHELLPNYKFVQNKFEDFNKFTEWSVDEFGYSELESSGRFWALDKDLLGDGFTYCSDSCLFVPQKINSFLTTRGRFRGEFPLGVTFHNKSGKFAAQCSGYGTSVRGHIGLYLDKYDAHRAWQQAKCEIAKEFTKEFVSHKKLVTGLNNLISRIETDISNNKETLYV